MSIIDDVRIHQDWTEDGYVFEDVFKPKITLAEIGVAESVERIDQLTGVIEVLTKVNKIMEEIPFESGIYQFDIPAEYLNGEHLSISFDMPVRFYIGDDCRFYIGDDK